MNVGDIGVVVFSLSIGLVVCWLGSVKIEKPTSRGFRGLIRSAQRRHGLFRVFDFGVRLLGEGVVKFISAERVQKKDEELVCSGELWGLNGVEFYGAVCVFFLLTSAIALFQYRILQWTWAPVCLSFCLGCSLPFLQLYNQKKTRQKSIERALPLVLDLVYMTMGAGLTLHNALETVAENLPNRKSPIKFELNRLLFELHVGVSLTDAIRNFSRRVRTDSASDFAHWVIQSEEKGTPLRQLFQKQASSLRQKRSVKAEESAAKAGAALMLPMTMMFGAVMIIVLTPLIVKMKGMDI